MHVYILKCLLKIYCDNICRSVYKSEHDRTSSKKLCKGKSVTAFQCGFHHGIMCVVFCYCGHYDGLKQTRLVLVVFNGPLMDALAERFTSCHYVQSQVNSPEISFSMSCDLHTFTCALPSDPPQIYVADVFVFKHFMPPAVQIWIVNVAVHTTTLITRLTESSDSQSSSVN